MTYNEKDFKALGGSSRRYLNISTGQEISRRQRDKLLGKLDNRPSAKPVSKSSTPSQEKQVRKTTVEGKLTGEKPKPRSNRLRHYNTRVKAYAQHKSMMLSDVRKDKTFQSLNKDISSDLKKLDKLESNLQKSLLEHKLGILSGGLTEDKYNKMVAKISESDLTAKQKEKIFNQMHKIREARMKLGDKFKQVGLKDNNDFSALGDTPKA
jgi:uncharacterized protein (DUF342 family)